MAALAQKGGKAPVAGQPGYDPFTKAPDNIVTDELEQSVRPVQPRAKREVSQKAIDSARKATPTELLDNLVETGTNPEKLASARLWIMDNPDATAEHCFRYLEDAEAHGHQMTNPGTIRKAGKWLWGDQWEPEVSAMQLPSEREAELRIQVSKLQGEIALKNSELVSVRNQLQFAQEQIRTYGAENDYLKRGRDPKEFGPGKNVLIEPASAVA